MKKLIFGILFLCTTCMEAQTYNYDVNGDGIVDIADVTYLTNHLLGKLNTGEVGPVDLGLPSGTKWANCNIGAAYPEEYGLYFAWGDTVGYASIDTHSFTTSTYRWYDSTGYNKYCVSSSFGTVDDKTALELDDDAAHYNWGGTWRMPTYDEMQELYENCDWTKETLNGTWGYRATSKINGNSIFFPAPGCLDSSTHSVGSLGSYWTSSLYTDYGSDCGYCLYFSKTKTPRVNGQYRYFGRNIRPVCP